MNIQQFNYAVTLLQALLWQYNEASRIQILLNEKDRWYELNQKQFWDNWYTNVFNLQTANAFGLSLWSIILNIPLFIGSSPDPVDKPIWGFNEVVVFPDYINSYKNFQNGNYSNGGTSFQLTLEEQRLILRLRYYKLVSRGAVPETNKFLATVFKDYGNVYMLDGLDMTITYVFTFDLSYTLRFLIRHFDLLPRPAGVGIKYVIKNGMLWGFNEVTTFPEYVNTNENFENGNFPPEF